MKIDNLNILAELERLGAAFPWEKVELQIDRRPEGEVSFIAYLSSDSDAGRDYLFARGASPAEAVDNAIKQGTGREPEAFRQKRLAQLRESIRKLEAAEIPAMPPYRPNRELAAGVLTVADPVVEV